MGGDWAESSRAFSFVARSPPRAHQGFECRRSSTHHSLKCRRKRTSILSSEGVGSLGDISSKLSSTGETQSRCWILSNGITTSHFIRQTFQCRVKLKMLSGRCVENFDAVTFILKHISEFRVVQRVSFIPLHLRTEWIPPFTGR